MAHTIKVEPKSGQAVGWIVECYKWRDESDQHPLKCPLLFVQDKQSFVATVQLDPGIYSLECTVTTGVKLTITLDPKERIIQPSGGVWPIEAAPRRAFQDFRAYYFEVGAAS